MPGIESLAILPRSAILREVAAGLSVAAIAVPIGLAYAKLLGVPPEVGLYASMGPTLAYALFGPSSRYMIAGPDAPTCLVLAVTITSFGITAPDERAAVAAGLTLLVGIGCLVAGALRLGFLANLISRPVLVGYLAGSSLTLLISQLPSLTQVDLHSPGIIRPFLELIRRQAEIHWPTLAAGIFFLVLLRVLKRVTPRVPAPLVALALALLASWAFDWPSKGFVTVGKIPSALPPFRMPEFAGSPVQMAYGVAGILIISFTSGILTARAFGQRIGAESFPNKELAGFAAADIAGGLFQGFVVTGADSRTAVALNSGGRSSLVGIVAAIAVAAAVLFLSPLLAVLPVVVLGAILLSAAIDLFDVDAFRKLIRIDPIEFAIALTCTAGVIWIGVLRGVFIAVLLTFVHLIRVASVPRDAVLGRAEGSRALVTLRRDPGAREPKDVLVYLFESSIIFLNATRFRERVLEALAERPGTRWLVLDASSMVYADSAAVEALVQLKAMLDGQRVGLMLGGGHGRFRDTLERSGVADMIGRNRIFDTPERALDEAEKLLAG
jgi:high affinity sulfate transporter 1